MAMFTSPVTGVPVTAKLTSPTYTLTKTSSPQNNAVTYLVSSIGGTQTDVQAHSSDIGFTHRFIWPIVQKMVAAINESANPMGRLIRWPKNRWALITRKTTLCTVYGYDDIVIETTFTVPVGASSYSPQNIAAAISSHGGELTASSDEFYAAIVSGINPT